MVLRARFLVTLTAALALGACGDARDASLETADSGTQRDSTHDDAAGGPAPDGAAADSQDSAVSDPDAGTPDAQTDAGVSAAGEHCGGNSNAPKVCATGLTCIPAPNQHVPFGDVGGICEPPCDADGGCAGGATCAYPVEAACAAHGYCMVNATITPSPLPPLPVPSCCKCDGTNATDYGCASKGPAQYTPWPVDHIGECAAADASADATGE